LAARHSLASFAGEAGDPASARDQLLELVADSQRVCGAADHETLLRRAELAVFTSRAGDPMSAREQFVVLIADFTRVCGPEDFLTLSTELLLALAMGEAGDFGAALAQAWALMSKLNDPHPVLETNVRNAIKFYVRRLLFDGPVSIADPHTPEGQLVATLQSAVAGSAEALVRLPSELVEIVESLRASEAVGSR